MMIWFLLHNKSLISVLVYVKPQKIKKNQVLVNHCVYSPTYLMLKIKQQNVALNLKNKNSDPLKLEIANGPINGKEKGIQK